MKEENKENISNSGVKHFELKAEYLDDLNKKLDQNKARDKRKIYFFLMTLFCVIGLITFLLLPRESTSTEQSIALNREAQGNGLVQSVIKEENTIHKSEKQGNDVDVKRLLTEERKEIDNGEKTVKSGFFGNRNKEGNKSSSFSKLSKKDRGIGTKKALIKKPLSVPYSKQSIKERKHKKGLSTIQFNGLIDSRYTRFKEVNSSQLFNLKTDCRNFFQPRPIRNSDKLIAYEGDSSITKSHSDTNLMKKDSVEERKKWQASILVGSNFSYSLFSNQLNQAYFNKRKKEELVLPGFSGGILLEKFIGNNIKVSTGMSYVKYGSNNKYTPSLMQEDSRIYNGMDTSYNSFIDSIYYIPTRRWLTYLVRIDTVLDSNFNQTIVSRLDSTAYLARGKVSFSYVEIPVMLGYYKTINKWNVGVNTGISIGLLTRKGGYYINENLKSVQLANSNKIMINYLLSPEINYQFSNNYYIGFQPFFKLGLNNLSISEPIDRRYYNIQLNAKIGIRF